MRINKKGFSLIEILVVLFIISMLSALAVVGTRNMMKRARDNKRISDLKQIQTALMIYKDENGSFPETSAYGEREEWGWDTSLVDEDRDGTKWLDFLKDGGQMSQIPLDPKNCTSSVCGKNYSYRYARHYACGEYFVVIQAVNLEKTPDSRGNVTCTDCTGCGYLDALNTGYTVQVFESD